MQKLSLFAAAAATLMTFAGSAVAQSGDVHKKVMDMRNQPVHDERGNCVRTKWIADTDICADAMPTAEPAPRLQVKREERTVYFNFNRSNITPSEQQKLNTLITTIKNSKQVTSVDILGFADEIGSSSYNKQLSLKRAYAVKRYLGANGGITTRNVDLAGLGESRSVTNCSKDLPRNQRIACLARDRRVEILLNYAE